MPILFGFLIPVLGLELGILDTGEIFGEVGHIIETPRTVTAGHGMVMWDEIFEEISQDYRDITTDKMLVDAMTTRMVLDPQSIDTVVASNLHADLH